jgi:hypothetical protein
MMFEIKMAKPAKKMPSFLILRDLFVVRDSYTLRHHTSQLCVDAVAIAIATSLLDLFVRLLDPYSSIQTTRG